MDTLGTVAIASMAVFASGFVTGAAVYHRTTRHQVEQAPDTASLHPIDEDEMALVLSEISRVLIAIAEQRAKTVQMYRGAGLLVSTLPPPRRTLAQEVRGALDLAPGGYEGAFRWREVFPEPNPNVDISRISSARTALHNLLRTLFAELSRTVRIPPNPHKRTRFANDSTPDHQTNTRHAASTPWAPAPARVRTNVSTSPSTPSSSRRSTNSVPPKRTFAFYTLRTDDDDDDNEGQDTPLKHRPTRPCTAATAAPVRTLTSAAIFEVRCPFLLLVG